MPSFRSDFSSRAAVQGLIVSIVGYASSAAIVIAGLKAVGATTAQIASGLMIVGIAKGLTSIILSLRSRMPVSVAWTTPGLALLATTGVVEGGFAAAVGAFLITGALIVISAFWQRLGQLVAAIPRPIASAMLAGVLLKLCLAPFVALKTETVPALAILATWLLLYRFLRLYAVPAAVVVALGFIGFGGGTGEVAFALPHLEWVTPVFNLPGLMSIALPLFIVTMAGQNITGLAVLQNFGYRHDPRDGLGVTGLFSMLIAPFCGPTINYAAITAALCAGPDAHPDPSRRYVAAVVSGVGYMLFSALAAVAAEFVAHSSPVLIEATAGMALAGAFGGAMLGAVSEEKARIPALMTFFLAASGFSLWGIGGAFWGLLAGWGAYLLLRADEP